MSAERKYDWSTIRRFYEAGHTMRECQARFGFSNGAWVRAIERGEVVSKGTPKPRGHTRRAVERLLEEGIRPAEIARRLGVSKPTVSFHMRMMGLAPRVGPGRRYDWEAIRAHYEAGNSMAECVRRFGFSRNAWSDAVARGAIVPRPRLEPLEDLLAAGRPRNRYHVKSRLLVEGLKGDRCETCGLREWNHQPLALELHHVNGDGLDNRLENLRLLCPNCHSQTDTWGGRNKRVRHAAGHENMREGGRRRGPRHSLDGSTTA